MLPIAQISKEVENRLNVWRFLIKEMYQSLLVAEELWDMAIKEGAYQIYSRPYVIAEKNLHYNFCFTARQAIFTQIVISFGNIYGPGKGGVGFSKNSNEQCKLFMNEMESFISKEAKVSQTEYLAFKDKIINMRNEQVAHFDGSKAEYTVADNGWVTNHRSPLVNFDQNEFLEVKSVIEAMHKHTERYFTATKQI